MPSSTILATPAEVTTGTTVLPCEVYGVYLLSYLY